MPNAMPNNNPISNRNTEYVVWNRMEGLTSFTEVKTSIGSGKNLSSIEKIYFTETHIRGIAIVPINMYIFLFFIGY
jgi:hypothetical protein